MRAEPDDAARVAAAYMVAERTLASIEESLLELAPWTFEKEQLASLNSADRKALDAFLKRFENLVEAGRRLFRAALIQGREEQRGLSAGEVALRMEQLGLIDSADAWAQVVSARNTAAHDYSADLEEAAEALPLAYAAAASAVEIVRSLVLRLRVRFPTDPEGRRE